MNKDKLAINWQNFAQVRLHLKLAFRIWRVKAAKSATWPRGLKRSFNGDRVITTA